jgi:hypothetical protein
LLSVKNKKILKKEKKIYFIKLKKEIENAVFSKKKTVEVCDKILGARVSILASVLELCGMCTRLLRQSALSM